jgi:hypothetical protein
MKNNIFFMTLGVISVWREQSPDQYFACVFVDEYEEDYQIKIIQKNINAFELVLKLFDEVNYENGSIYLTTPPIQEIIESAAVKKIKNIFYIPSSVVTNNNPKISVVPWVHTFGKIIDVLSCYKPKDIILNTV